MELADLEKLVKTRRSIRRWKDKTAPAANAIAAARYQAPIDQVLEAREKTDPLAARMRLWRNTADSRVQSVASAIAHLLLVLPRWG